MRRTWVGIALLAAFAVHPADAASRRKAKAVTTLEPQAVNDAAPPGRLGRGLSPLALKTAVLLDRARFSPGVVDGRGGLNLTKAIKAFQAAQGLDARGLLDAGTWATLSGSSAEPALVEYVIRPEDLKGPFLDKVPPKMEEMQGLKALSYTSPLEMLAERHHMSEALLVALNRGKDLGLVGTAITVANVAPVANLTPVPSATPAPNPAPAPGAPPASKAAPASKPATAANAAPPANAAPQATTAPVPAAAPTPMGAPGANAPVASVAPASATGATAATATPVPSIPPATANAPGRGPSG